MIEFCSRKKMVLGILILISLTVLTLIAEGMWSTNHRLGEEIAEEEKEDQCGSSELKLIHDCAPCTSYELKIESAFCQKTGYREEIKCGNDETTIKRSCKIDPRIQERQFWLLELSTCVLGLVSYGVVKYRQGKLDQLLLDKVNRQIAA